jgi:orotate phosphoribosyltransferase
VAADASMAPMSNLSDVQAEFLQLLVSSEALRFGSFTLKSGRMSPYFVNTGAFHHGGDLGRIGRCYAAIIRERIGDDVDLIFGPAYKGIPLALATAAAYEELIGRPVAWCYDRKEAKDHGDGGSFVGAPLTAGTKTVLVDDVLTAGTALRESIAKLAPTGINLAAAVISVDRQEPGPKGTGTAREEIAADHALPVEAIITISEAVDYLEANAVNGVRYLDADQAATIRAHLGR